MSNVQQSNIDLALLKRRVSSQLSEKLKEDVKPKIELDIKLEHNPVVRQSPLPSCISASSVSHLQRLKEEIFPKFEVKEEEKPVFLSLLSSQMSQNVTSLECTETQPRDIPKTRSQRRDNPKTRSQRRGEACMSLLILRFV